MEKLYGGHLCYGPPIEEGFYYDMWCERYFISLQEIFTTMLDIIFLHSVPLFLLSDFPPNKRYNSLLKANNNDRHRII